MQGDLYEYMLGKLATAGQNGQFRRICEVHAPRDYKWFAFSVAYSDSEKKKYSVDTKARFLELFEVDEEKVFAEEFHKM